MTSLRSELPEPRELLEKMPVFQSILLRGLQDSRSISVFIKMFREPSFRTCESDEVDSFSRLRINVPVILHVGISRQAETFLHLCSFSRIVNEYREAARIRGKFGLMFGHVVADAVFGLACREYVDNGRAGEL